MNVLKSQSLVPQDVTVFGHGAYPEVTQLRDLIRAGPNLIWLVSSQEEEIWTHKLAVCEPRKEASKETSPAGSWLDFQRLQNERKFTFLLSQPPGLRSFVNAAQADRYTHYFYSN